MRSSSLVLLLLCGSLVALLAGGTVGRVRWLLTPELITAERAGWRLEYTVSRIGCRCCSAQLRRLEFDGRPFTRPAFIPASSNGHLLVTPVGSLEFVSGSYWPRIGIVASDVGGARPTPITAEELERGYVEGPDRPGDMPESWLLVTAKEQQRWCDPRRLADSRE